MAVKRNEKAVDPYGRRLYCRDGHLIQWPEYETDYFGKIVGNGYCQTGELWEMDRVGAGRSQRYRLRQTGKLGWTHSGQFSVTRKANWAVKAHEVRATCDVGFDCSHAHYRTSIYSQAPAQPLPECVAYATDAESVRVAVQTLVSEHWDFTTDDRIRCPDCIAEENELERKLTDLKARDEQAAE